MKQARSDSRMPRAFQPPRFHTPPRRRSAALGVRVSPRQEMMPSTAIFGLRRARLSYACPHTRERPLSNTQLRILKIVTLFCWRRPQLLYVLKWWPLPKNNRHILSKWWPLPKTIVNGECSEWPLPKNISQSSQFSTS